MLKSKKNLLEKCEELGITCSKSLPKEKLSELISQKQKTKTVHIENPSMKKVKYVYHLADIHIRYIERHSEYRDVFNKLYDIINNDEKIDQSVMVISGDIFHNRDRFVGETIVLFDEFIKNISSKMEIFAIVGNHDCFNHSDRIDSISGISSIASYDNFHLLKESGCYVFSNITFGVSSLLDGMGIPSFLHKEEGNIKIALFHGIVSGCVMDNGMGVKDGLPVSSFKEYDLALLGDVHRRQFLNKAKTIAYPGSLIQQNFKEEIDHGFLKWDVDTLKSEFIVLQNDYCYMDIPVNSSLDLSTIKFSKNSRIRLVIDHKDLEQDISNTLEDCNKYTNVVSIKKIMKDPSLKNKEDVNDTKELYSSVDLQELDFIKQLSTPDSVDRILELHSKLSENIDTEEVFSKSLPWRISKIEFKNIFSYGNDHMNHIDLKKGITGILANNASGKTNILNTIMYGLFGTTRVQNHLNKNIVSRYSLKDDLFVKLTIDMQDGTVYYIERSAKTKTRSRIKSSEEGQLDISETLKFYTDEKILNLSTKSETEKHLRDILSILSREEFVLTNMMSNISYGSNMSIISMNGTQLDEVFNKIFNLGKYKLLHNKAKSSAKEIHETIKKNTSKLEFTEDNLKEYSNEESILKNIQKHEEGIKISEENHTSRCEQLKKIDDDLLKLKSSTLDTDEKTLKSQMVECDHILSEFDGDISELLLMEDDLALEYSSLKKVYVKSDTLIQKPKIKIKDNLSQISENISFLEGTRRIVDFDADMTNDYIRAKKYINSISLDSTLDIRKISEILSKLKMDSSDKNYMLPKEVHKSIMEDFKKTYVDPSLVLKYKKIIEEKESRDSIARENIEIDQKINTLKKDMKNRRVQEAHETRERLIELSAFLEYIDVHKDKIDIKNQLLILEENRDVKLLLSKKNNISNLVKEAADSLKLHELGLQEEQGKLQKVLKFSKQKNELVPILEHSKKELDIYKNYIDLTHQKNLPKVLISSVVKNIVKDANSLIYNTTGLLCDIQENEKWEIVIKKDNITLGPDHCSGYERMMLNIGLKIAFDKYKQLSSINIFMIDETIDCVSESNLDQIDTLLEYLEEHYKSVIMISHNEELKKKIDNRINIKLIDKCSFIQS